MIQADDRVEVRLLGPLRVRRADGSSVEIRAWRTGKTADLLRMLALSGGLPVGVDAILNALWPAVNRDKGLISMRTAASQIRRVLRENCVVQQPDGLVFGPAWVDTVAFKQLAHECRGVGTDRRWQEVVSVARQAEALYVGDLSAVDPSVELLDLERQSLRNLRLRLLLDAADAAIELCWYRDGIDFANRALTLDPYSERAFRALMTGHAGAGETQPALAAFEQCRAVLAADLGAEPSEQTRAVHLRILSPQLVTTDASSVDARVEQTASLLDSPTLKAAGVPVGHPRELARTYEQLPAELLNVLAMIAVLGGHTRASTLSLLLDSDEPAMAEALHELADLSVLKLEKGDYTFRVPSVGDDLLAWLRPAERGRLHQLVTTRTPMHPGARIHHRLAADHPSHDLAVAV